MPRGGAATRTCDVTTPTANLAATPKLVTSRLVKRRTDRADYRRPWLRRRGEGVGGVCDVQSLSVPAVSLANDVNVTASDRNSSVGANGTHRRRCPWRAFAPRPAKADFTDVFFPARRASCAQLRSFWKRVISGFVLIIILDFSFFFFSFDAYSAIIRPLG